MEGQDRGKDPLTHEQLADLVFKEIDLLIEAGHKDYVESKIFNGSLHEFAVEVSKKYAGLPYKLGPDPSASEHTPTRAGFKEPSSFEEARKLIVEHMDRRRENPANTTRPNARQIALAQNCDIWKARPVIGDKRGGFLPGRTWEHRRVNPGPTLGPLSQFKQMLVVPPVAKVDASATTETRSDAVEPVDGESKTDDDGKEVEDGEERTTLS